MSRSVETLGDAWRLLHDRGFLRGIHGSPIHPELTARIRPNSHGFTLQIKPKSAVVATQATVFTLHRYFLAADRMRYHHETHVKTLVATPGGDTNELVQAQMYLGLWYGCLFVVVEGYESLGLSDPIAASYLAERHYVRLLRDYRHAIFHYSPTYEDERFHRLYAADQIVRWVHGLHAALGAVILREMKQPP